MKSSEENKPIVLVKEIPVNEVKSIIVQNRLKKLFYGVIGVLSLILAILGIIVPGLPCTPFALLSAAMFAKSSDKLYNKLLSNKILGSRIRNYQRNKGISKSGKVKVIILMWTMVILSAFVIIKLFALRVIVLSAGLVGALVVWLFVPEAQINTTENEEKS